jgi:peptidoglycan/LPS O-acetylase OafA/YrhL
MEFQTSRERDKTLKEDRFTQLDGLRGWASFMVLINHVFPNFLYHDSRLERVSSLIQDPAFSRAYLANIANAIFSVIYFFISDGTLAVKIFFVLSGYVLSICYFNHKNRTVVIDQALRRYVRLTVPVLFSAMIGYGLLKMGLMYNQQIANYIDGAWISKFYAFSANLNDAALFALYSVYFDYQEKTSYNFAAWTMGIELVGSYLVFATLLFIGNVRWRMGGYAILFMLSLAMSHYLPCFIAGLAIADFYSQHPANGAKRPRKIYVSLLILPLIILLILAVSKITNPTAATIFETAAACIILLVAVYNQGAIDFLRLPFSQFFGQISFPLYLIHPVILCSAASAFGVTVISATGRDIGVPMTAAFSVLASIGVARFLLPVEKFAIYLSRKTSILIRKIGAMGFNSEGARRFLGETSRRSLRRATEFLRRINETA